MTERPILFTAEMVQAIQAGQKTQTRRLHNNKPSPYGVAGDRLWVRETWTASYEHSPPELLQDYPFWHHELSAKERESAVSVEYFYRANGEFSKDDREDGAKWQSGMYMPRTASRLTLQIKSIRVERLNAITEDDAKAEGVENVAEYKALWERINGVGSWDANPWVWVIEFEKITTTAAHGYIRFLGEVK